MKLKFRADPKDIMIFIIFIMFAFYLISIGVLNALSILEDGTLSGLNPFPIFTSDSFFLAMILLIAVLIIAITSVSSYFFEREKGIGIKTGKKEDKGYSRWCKDKEMKKELTKIFPQDIKIEKAGLPLINNGKELWLDTSGYHNMIIGSTGSGKSQTMSFPYIRALAKAGESMIVTDPKGELYEGTANELRERGYNIILLNFREPQSGNCWNPFSLPYKLYKEGDVDKATELLEDLAKNILYDESSKGQDPFWENTSADYFTGLSLALFDDAKEEEINLNSINLMSTVGEEKIGGTTFIKEYFSDKDQTGGAYINASSTLMAPNETKGSILAVFKQKIKLFSSRENLAEMLSVSDFDMKDIGRKKTAVFIVIQDEKKTYHSLVTIFLKQCYETLIGVAQESGGKLKYRTNFLLDEFANMPPLKDVTSMVSAARSRNIRLSFIIQNFSQLNDVYGKEQAETIRGNCGNTIYLLSTELNALEEISKLCGETKSKKDDKTASQPLITVSDLQHLKEGEIIVLRSRMMPFKTKVVFDYKMDWGKDYKKADYPKREKHQVSVFNIKGFVEEKRNKKINEMLGDSNKNMMSAGMPGGFNPAGMFGPKESKPTPGGFNVDDLVKRIDAKIAELEEEERLEKESEAKKNNKKSETKNTENNKKDSKNKTSEEKDKKESKDKSVEKPQEIKSTKEKIEIKYKKDEFVDNKQEIINDFQEVEMPIEDIEEITDDQFFDDFFYDEDE